MVQFMPAEAEAERTRISFTMKGPLPGPGLALFMRQFPYDGAVLVVVAKWRKLLDEAATHMRFDSITTLYCGKFIEGLDYEPYPLGKAASAQCYHTAVLASRILD